MATRRTQESRPTAENNPPQALTTTRARTRTRAALQQQNAPAGIQVSPERRRGMIAEAAYWRAERRGFAPGSEMEDWLAAEREIDALLSSGPAASQ